MHVIYLIDTPGWALDQIGALLAPGCQAAGIRFETRTAEDFHASPSPCDILYLSFPALFRAGFSYRQFAGALVTTIHDPFEVSWFQDRRSWSRYPLIPLDVTEFDRISVLTTELERVVSAGYDIRPFLTPTFPPEADALRSRRRERGAGPITFFSSTNKPARFGFPEVFGRWKSPGRYLRDQRGRIAPKQLLALTVVRGRKNIPLLDKLRKHLAGRPNAAVNFVHGPGVLRIPREVYLERLLAADVYVCTSFMEGGPLPVMEAVLGGAAVISADVGQVRDWVQHGVNGFICGRPGEFLAAADRYLESPALLRAHQAASRRIGDAKRFDFEPWHRFLLGIRTEKLA